MSEKENKELNQKKQFINIQLFGEPDSSGIADTDGDIDTDIDYDDTDDYSYIDDLDNAEGETDIDDADGDDTDVENESIQPSGEPKENDNKAFDIEAIRREAYERGIREGRVAAFSGKKNEYTGQPIKDEYDLEVYETMRKIEEKGGDPVADFASEMAERRRQEAQKANERVQTEQKYQTELVEFAKEMPDVDLKVLFNDPKFRTFARGKLGVMSLKEVYADYSALTATAENDAELKAKRIVAKQKASPGALGAGAPAEKSIENLSDDEFENLYRKALRGDLKKS